MEWGGGPTPDPSREGNSVSEPSRKEKLARLEGLVVG